MATIKEAITKLMSMDSSEIDAFVGGKTKPVAKREKDQTSDKDVSAEPDGYNGETNIMKLKKMARDAGMEVTNKTKKAEVIAYLNENAPSIKKETKRAESRSLDDIIAEKKYTREQLETFGSRDLYNRAREVFNIPREKLKNKNDIINALMKAQAGESEDASEGYEGKKPQELAKICKERGIEYEIKKPASYYIELLEADDAASEEEEESEYSGMKPQELAKLCKERGIEYKIKQPKEYYIELLEAADEESSDEWGEDSEDDEEDWTL